MRPVSVPAVSETTVALCIFFIFLVPFAAAGLSLINTGLGRARSAAHAMLASLCVIAVAACVYLICGFAWQGYIGRPGHVITVAGHGWNWIAAEPFFFHGVALDGSAASLAVWLQMFSVGIAALIPLGSGGDRWRLGAICVSTALLAGWTYPLFAHWVWGGGWLAQLGVNYGLGRGFIDAGGSGTIQVVGGLTALAIAWILGPRRGKYSPQGIPAAAIPGHNAVLVSFGCLLALVGWLGLNCAGAILFTGMEFTGAVLIGINTTLAAASAALAAVAVTRMRFGKPDASLSANGWVSGLVASGAACAFITPGSAIVIGLAAGTLVTLAVEWLDRLAVDDPGGAISVHAVGGIWGIMAVGLFARFSGRVLNTGGILPNAGNGDADQWLAQLVGVATLLGFVLPLTYGLNRLLNRFCPHRVAAEGERQGMDLHELGAGAYPEFVSHTEDFTAR